MQPRLVRVARFIPTRVGNRERPCRAAGRAPVHPHARGEQLFATNGVNAIVGSSPRAWGTVQEWTLRPHSIRFIPTRVGNRDRDRLGAWLASVHPHARGEQMVGRIQRSITTGSSPRAWGTASRLQLRSRCRRFIPTRVGNSFACASRGCGLPVHPHARGEQVHLARIVTPSIGSSPRAWGTGPDDG